LRRGRLHEGDKRTVKVIRTKKSGKRGQYQNDLFNKKIGRGGGSDARTPEEKMGERLKFRTTGGGGLTLIYQIGR